MKLSATMSDEFDSEGVEQSNKKPVGETYLAIQKETTPAVPDFVKIETDLIALGFFTPSSKKIKGVKEKIVRITREVDGRKIEGEVHIIPAAKFGLPITADQDKYLALKRLLRDVINETGTLVNPTSFTSAQLNRVAGKQARQGKNNGAVVEFLKRLFHTSVEFVAIDPNSTKKPKASLSVHVLDKLYTFGETLEDGTVADKHLLWWSDWLLEQINKKKQLPVDHEVYKDLKNDIAKILVPHLQRWLFASQDQGSFEKRYDEICQLLRITEYKYQADIWRQLKFALDELLVHRYLSKWEVVKTIDQRAYKIVFYHGEKYYQDRAKRIEQKENKGRKKVKPVLATQPAEQGSEQPTFQQIPFDLALTADEAHQLTSRLICDFGITYDKAKELVGNHLEQTKLQLEVYPFRKPPTDKAGWIIKAIEESYSLPADYLKRQQQQEAARAAEAEREVREACQFCRGGYRQIKKANPDTGQIYEAFRKCTHDPAIEGNLAAIENTFKPVAEDDQS